MPKSGYLQRQAIREQAIVLAVENTTQQLMLDTLQVTMHREYGWGYDRIKVRLSNGQPYITISTVRLIAAQSRMFSRSIWIGNW